MGAREHRDGVELHRAQMPEEAECSPCPRMTARARGARRDTPEEALGAELKPSCLLEGDFGGRHAPMVKRTSDRTAEGQPCGLVVAGSVAVCGPPSSPR